jgi:RNA polymerase sigma factor (sigma-70 family)
MTATPGQSMLQETELNGLFQYAMVLCQQRDDAYDLLQSTVEKYLIEVKRGQRVIRNRQAYLHTLMRNRFIDHLRHQQRWRNEVFEESGTYDISPVCLEQVCIDKQELEHIWSGLPVLDRDILYHWAVLGYSTDEACEQLDIPRGTFLSRIHRLRKTLQREAKESPRGEQAR